MFWPKLHVCDRSPTVDKIPTFDPSMLLIFSYKWQRIMCTNLSLKIHWAKLNIVHDNQYNCIYWAQLHKYRNDFRFLCNQPIYLEILQARLDSPKAPRTNTVKSSIFTGWLPFQSNKNYKKNPLMNVWTCWDGGATSQ